MGMHDEIDGENTDFTTGEKKWQFPKVGKRNHAKLAKKGHGGHGNFLEGYVAYLLGCCISLDP